MEFHRSQDFEYNRKLVVDQIRNEVPLCYSLQAEKLMKERTTETCKECCRYLTEKELELYETKLFFETPWDTFCSETCQANYWEPDFLD